MGTNDRQLAAYLDKMPGATHLRPLAQVVNAYAVQLKDELQKRTSAGGRVNPVSEASMVDLILRIERLYTRVEEAHRKPTLDKTRRGGV